MPLDSFGRSELHYAALEGDRSGVDRLIAAGADVNLPDRHGWTPLHFAAQSRQTEVALRQPTSWQISSRRFRLGCWCGDANSPEPGCRARATAW